MKQTHKEQQQSETKSEDEVAGVPKGVGDIREAFPPRSQVFLPTELKDAPAEVKLVYRYICKCQNATVEELIEKTGLSEERVWVSISRLLQSGYVKRIEESSDERFRWVEMRKLY